MIIVSYLFRYFLFVLVTLWMCLVLHCMVRDIYSKSVMYILCSEPSTIVVLIYDFNLNEGAVYTFVCFDSRLFHSHCNPPSTPWVCRVLCVNTTQHLCALWTSRTESFEAHIFAFVHFLVSTNYSVEVVWLVLCTTAHVEKNLNGKYTRCWTREKQMTTRSSRIYQKVIRIKSQPVAHSFHIRNP